MSGMVSVLHSVYGKATVGESKSETASVTVSVRASAIQLAMALEFRSATGSARVSGTQSAST
jgi:hypothetical protein